MERRDFELPDPDWMRDLSHCPLSDRDKELLEKFWTELENDRMEHCARCQETWFDMGLKGGICKRCIARDKNKKEDEPWFFSAENQLDFGLIPAFLPQLTIVEEMLIARVHVFVNVMQVRGQQYKYRGHIVHFLRDVGKVYSQLPLLPPELDVILLRPPTASEHAHLNRQFRRQFRVRRRCLQEWLNFLSNNHPGYRGITVCQKRMSVLPEDGDVLDQVATAAVTDPLSANLVPDLLPEDTEMEALRSHVLGEERGEHLPVRPSTQHQLEMPDIRRTPINEFNHSQALLSLAFPTLFPRGQADFVEPRLRPIKYADYIQHALRWHDGRFARHPTFRFVVFNTLMRAQARAKSSYFVKEYQQRQGLITRDDLLEAFQNPESAEAQQLLNSINRQTAQLRGTRPYWYRKRRELESYAYNLDCPGAFITFSPADLHWRSLYQHLPQFQDWQELPEQQRMGMSSKLLRDNPHIAAWHFYRRFGLFRDIVLKQKFNVTDYWNRYEWQGRGSSHCHGLFWMDGAPSVDLENEHLRKEFARIWRFHVTAFNPEPARVRQQGEGNPLAVNPLQHPLTFQWLSQVLNRCQRHHCSETYCLRKKKGSEEISCRFFFPRDTRDTADVVRRQGQSYFSFEAARNDSLMNHYNRCLSLGWLANIDISPCTSLQAVINYAAKYCSKMEKRTDSYASMGRQILPYVSHQNPLLSFASRLMNKLLTERDFSGQEICHVLLNCELQEGTRVIRAVDCRPYEQQGRSLRLQGDHDDAEVVGIYEKYLSRPPLHEELTYLDFLANWNTSKRDGRKWTRWSRQAKPRVLYYFPRYKSNHQHHQYDDFCRVKLMLAHPHRDPNELRKINGVEYNSYASAAEFCYGNHRHPDDYYGTPNAEERRPDPDEFEEEFHEPDLLEEDWLELARQLPDCPPSQEAIDLLGRRDIDIQYDWTPHVGRYADPGIVQGDYWRQRIEQNRLYMDVEDMPLEVRDALNPEQRIVYDTFIGHFQCGSEEQILLHVDGGGGTGKSYMIKVLSSHLQRLAGNRPSPIWRAAPTGVASNQIMGTTLHSLLRLPMDRAFTELSPADANAIQKKLRDVRYLVIDEKSMLGLRQLSWIDKRLRQVFPARAAEFFGGISIILVGDFFQLPPIANKPLYFDGPLKDLHEVSGQTAYRAFNHTVFLKKVQRQQGDDQAGFRLALEELRGLKLSIESWKLLSQRVQVKLSQREEDTFDAALRIYSKKARVNEYNYEHLVRLKHPAIQVMAKNIGNGADKATSEQAGNLAGQFPPAGLVNGAQGTVYDIGWAPGADAHRDPPSVIMMVMDKCFDESPRPGPASRYLVIDNAFLGITPLYSPHPEYHKVDIIAIPGLGGHPFGSFKERDGNHMWLRDSLPNDLTHEDTTAPIARVMIYGYGSSVANSNNFQNLEDLSTSFYNSLLALARAPTAKPIIFVAHSLGGLIVKQSKNEDDLKLVKATYGIVFFGVPHDGMDISSLIPMVRDGPNRFLIESISHVNSQILSIQQREFHAALGDQGDSEIFCFYETEKSPTAHKDENGDWSMLGPKACLVTKSSATHCRSWERGPEHTCAISRTHSEMVKFGPQDHEYHKARERLIGLARRAVVAQHGKQSADVKSSKYHWMVPFERNEGFVGREDILRLLLKRTPPSTQPDACQRTVIQGLGGVGKTQIALEAAYRLRDTDNSCSVFWVPAVDATTFENAYRDIGQQLGVAGLDDDKADIKALVQAAMNDEDAGRWLLIIDNADDPELMFGLGGLARYLPCSMKGSILFTTRTREVMERLDVHSAGVIKAAKMSQEEAREMMRTRLTETHMQDTASTDGLLDFLDHLPLAIRQASAYMHKTGISTVRVSAAVSGR
ncbi:hypothetical protein HZS61_002668 [Fusarium oxysporum f. sp. conglutinans]|uniref:ATP-dependent DNA helicase n=1 Tax=Fusarium oxysporum f. sp. conglutinans TaxID=100902 RepID=A0A8H6GFB1_FUSOX|nr:hypothetical protein HZS61_002668 [Fusarium oxysporum f. sp. conglutinans]